MSTIYRKYRPQTFVDVIGQEHIIQTITNEIKHNKIAHAYLFSGPRGVGKTTLARLLAKAANCQNRAEGEYEPCNKCSSCVEVTGGNNIDVIEIDAASNTGVENVRENIIDSAQFKPTKSKYKIFIIDEVHMLSNSAFNALLKTLEEPPSHVLFILATTEQHKLPDTIISRCQRFNFKKVGFDDMLVRLKNICKEEDVKINDKILERVINKSDGCLRDAESLLGQILSTNLKKIEPEDIEMILPASNAQTVLQFIENIFLGQTNEAINLIQKALSAGANLEQFAYDTIEALRYIMIAQTGPDKNLAIDYGEKDAKTVRQLTAKIAPAILVKMIESLSNRRREIKTMPIPQLPLELFAVEFSAPQINSQTTTEITIEEKKTNFVAPKPEAKVSFTQTIKDTISTITHCHQAPTTTLAEIKNKWADVICKLSELNHSLTFTLKMCEVKEITPEGLYLTVPYSFHCEKINEVKSRKIIEQCLSEIFNENILLHCAVVEGAQNQNTVSQEINELAADFGGEVVS